MTEKPYRILHRDNENDIYDFFQFDTTKYETAEAALQDADKEYPNEECVIVKLCYLKHCADPSVLPDTWISYLPDK